MGKGEQGEIKEGLFMMVLPLSSPLSRFPCFIQGKSVVPIK